MSNLFNIIMATVLGVCAPENQEVTQQTSSQTIEVIHTMELNQQGVIPSIHFPADQCDSAHI